MTDYPTTKIIASPKRHTHTLIFLHGRGDTANQFGTNFADAQTLQGLTLQQNFPGLKLVFPGAPLRDSVLHRIKLFMWFDVFHPNNPSLKQESQIPGLKESVGRVHHILEEEVKLVGEGNVLLGGLSQGCATSLISMLALERLDWVGGFVGMSGYLPFAAELFAALQELERDNGNSGGGLDPIKTLLSRHYGLCHKLQGILALPPSESDQAELSLSRQIPYFLGHGTADNIVPVSIGENIVSLLKAASFIVTWKAYKDFGHWWKEPDEIDDLVSFLQEEIDIRAEVLPTGPSGPVSGVI